MIFDAFPKPINERHFNRYKRFIISRKSRNLTDDEYTERHHVLPKALGGLNTDDNLIKLSIKEHFIAHLMLWKCYPDSGMCMALKLIMDNKQRLKCNISTYIQRAVYSACSEYLSNKYTGNEMFLGENNNQYGKRWLTNGNSTVCVPEDEIDYYLLNGYRFGLSEEIKQKMSHNTKGRPSSNKGKVYMTDGTKNVMINKCDIPEYKSKGFVFGNTVKPHPVLQCPHCGKNGNSGNMHRWHFDNCKKK